MVSLGSSWFINTAWLCQCLLLQRPQRLSDKHVRADSLTGLVVIESPGTDSPVGPLVSLISVRVLHVHLGWRLSD